MALLNRRSGIKVDSSDAFTVRSGERFERAANESHGIAMALGWAEKAARSRETLSVQIISPDDWVCAIVSTQGGTTTIKSL